MQAALRKSSPLKASSPIKTPVTAKKARIVKVGLDRLDKIVRLGRRKSGVTMADLKRELDVSTASVKRDIEYLRDRMRCPINWDHQKQRYFIQELPDGGRFELPGLWFDASEVFALLMMLDLVDGIQPGLLGEHLNPMRDRLRSILTAGGKSAKDIERKVKLIHFAPRKVQPRHFTVVATALLDGNRLALHYLRRDKEEHTERVISPLQLVHYRDNWVLDGWCHMRGALRSFALEAIEDIRVVQEPAIKVSHEDMRDHFQSGYGIFAGKAVHRAVMKFTPKRAQWVCLETWHPDQTDRWLEDGSYVLEVPYSHDEELVMDLMRYGPEVEVLAPPELRERVHDVLCAAAKQYVP